MKRKPLPHWLRPGVEDYTKNKNTLRGIKYYRVMHYATPPWLDGEHRTQIRELEKERDRRNKMEGLTDSNDPMYWNLDHMVPLSHDLVCGLHVPWNLQLMRRCENASKSNRFWAHAPFPTTGFVQC